MAELSSFTRYKPSSLAKIQFGLSGSLKVESDCAIGPAPIFAFILVFNSNLWPVLLHLRDKSIHPLSDLDLKLLRSLVVHV